MERLQRDALRVSAGRCGIEDQDIADCRMRRLSPENTDGGRRQRQRGLDQLFVIAVVIGVCLPPMSGICV